MRNLFDGTASMDNVTDIYNQMEANCPNPCSTSQKLWELRCSCDITSHNPYPETRLEYAVANLAENGYMPEWFNQCPVASGITDSSISRASSAASNKRSCVDLVHWDEANKCARLVELKWDSDDPLSALRQILVYGIVYLFCRVHKKELPLQGRPLMDARHVSLEVVAPRGFYNGYNEKDRFAQMSKSLNEFASSKINGLTMSLDAFAFPDGFQIPFKDGADVKNKCKTQTAESQAVLEAFCNLTPVWP